MKEKILIVGAGGFGRVTLEHIIQEYECFFVDDNRCIGELIDGIKVVGQIKDISSLFEMCNKMIISIGDNQIRKSIYEKAKKIGYNFPSIICTSAYISPFAHIGEGCVVLNNVVVQNGSSVGDFTILNPGVEVHHDSSVGSFCCIYTNSVIRTYAKVCDGIKIGSNVTVKNESIINHNVNDGETV